MNKYKSDEVLALINVNYFQERLRNVKKKINQMKAELGKAGFEVEFEEVCDTLKFCDSDDIHIHPVFVAGGYLNNITICKISKKNSDDVIIKTKAEVAEGDLNIELLGEYLSLARATRIVLGDYNEY
jgi:hypothetical protein